MQKIDNIFWNLLNTIRITKGEESYINYSRILFFVLFIIKTKYLWKNSICNFIVYLVDVYGEMNMHWYL